MVRSLAVSYLIVAPLNADSDPNVTYDNTAEKKHVFRAIHTFSRRNKISEVRAEIPVYAHCY